MTDDDQTRHLEDLLEQVDQLDMGLAAYLNLWPSARISHARPSYLASAIRKEQEVIEVKSARKAELATARVATDAIRAEKSVYSDFEIEMAEMRRTRNAADPSKYQGGHTPAEYRAMVEANRAIPKQTPEQLAEVMRNAK